MSFKSWILEQIAFSSSLDQRINQCALTASNVFRGDQTISGSVYILATGSFSGGVVLPPIAISATGNLDLTGDQTISGSLYVYNTSGIVDFNTPNVNITSSTSISGALYIAQPTEVYRWGHKLFNYGQFHDTTTQTGSANTAYAMRYNSSESWNRGVRIVSQSQITVDNAGIYDLQFSAQLYNTANSVIDFNIWFRKDGVDIPYSNTEVELTKQSGTNGRMSAAWNYTTEFNSGSYIEIMWGCSAATGELHAATGSITGAPLIPSIIASMIQIG